jgi:hypothetical protein
LPTGVSDVGSEIFRGWFPAVFRRFLTPGATFQKRIRIVDSCGDVFSDAGANPAASRGDLDSTEVRFRRMRAEDHHPR